MALTAEGAMSPARSSGKERIVDFSPELLQAPFVLRCAAMLIDYMLLLAVPLVWMIVGRWMNDGSPVLPFGPTVWLIIILLWVINFLMLPLLRGQTFGKMLTGLTIVNMDGAAARLGRILVRNTIGYVLSTLTFGLGFVFAAVSPAGRALHDILSGTMVVRGRKKLV
jgi:uncharacterized RDD family membrane protein YckC